MTTFQGFALFVVVGIIAALGAWRFDSPTREPAAGTPQPNILLPASALVLQQQRAAQFRK